jgi:CheY-like chemotaxis protein
MATKVNGYQRMSSQKRILCVDDDSGTCELIAMILRDCQVTSAANKAEAIRLASSSNFDLIILDNNLPDGLGTEIAVLIRVSDQETPIIFSTADHSLTETHLDAIGAQRLIRKGPNFYDELKAIASDLLGKSA